MLEVCSHFSVDCEFSDCELYAPLYIFPAFCTCALAYETIIVILKRIVMTRDVLDGEPLRW